MSTYSIERFFDADMAFIIALFAYIGLNDVNVIVSISVGVVLIIAGITRIVLMVKQIGNEQRNKILKEEEIKKLRRENEKG